MNLEAKQGLRKLLAVANVAVKALVGWAAVAATEAILQHRGMNLQWPDVPWYQRPWFVAASIYVLILATFPFITYLWHFSLLEHLKESYSSNRSWFGARLLLSLIIPVPFAIGVAVGVSPPVDRDVAAAILFPQAADLGRVFIRTFASNGMVTYDFVNETPAYGPHGYAKITLRTNDGTAAQSAGWVLYLLRGSSIRDKEQLRFFIKGNAGGEKIGLKLKDADGTEVGVMLDGKPYLPDRKITTDWQEASIPLSHFGNVRLEIMDSLILFTDGSMALTEPQTVYVGGFQLLPLK
jgi:hypothetical protein